MFGIVEGLLSREATVSLYRPTLSSGGGGEPEWTAGTATDDDLRMKIEQISGGQRERAFGVKSEAEWKGLTDPDADIEENDLVVPNEGPYAGVVMEVESARTVAAGYPVASQGGFLVVALKKTEKTV